jgi:RimJ/RimL family protein N-acetyltransferase
VTTLRPNHPDPASASDFWRESALDSAKYEFRPANEDDARLLWGWANDPLTRKQSFNPAAIPWTEHERWFSGILASSSARLWILERDKNPVGQIRYERRHGEFAQISFSVTVPFRGRGIGTRLLLLTSSSAARELEVRRTRGTVFATNVASQRAFINAGFSIFENIVISGRDCVVFERSCEITSMASGALT